MEDYKYKIFSTGIMLEEDVEEKEENIRELHNKAAAGDVDACNRLGAMYMNGDGVAKDESEALKWYERAALAGSLEAMESIEFERFWYSEEVWIEFVLKAAEAGNHRAELLAADIYLKGNSMVEKSLSKAMDYYEKAAGCETEENLMKVAKIYFTGENGFVKDYSRAVLYFSKAYEKYHNLEALYNLGELYFAGGDGLVKDYKKALECFTITQEHGMFESAGRLGDIYYYGGNGVCCDYEKALYYYRLSGKEKSVESYTYEMGDIYFKGGYGVECDYDKARKCFEKAAYNGNFMAYIFLAEMYQYGEGVETDENQAVKYYDMALISAASVSNWQDIPQRKEAYAHATVERNKMLGDINKKTKKNFFGRLFN